MSSIDDDQDSRVVVMVLIVAVLLAVGVSIGVAVKKARGGAGASGAAPAVVAMADSSAGASASAGGDASAAMPGAAADPAMVANQAQTSAESMAPAVASASVTSADEASVVIENGVVKFYFASGKSDLASGAMVALGDAIVAAKGGKRLVVSGFHDASGNPAKNAELARQRAISVRDALVGAGVAESSVELKKPEEAVGSGNAAEARRVEVMIAE